MVERPPPGWIDAGQLFGGTPKSTLAEWRKVGILPEPISAHLGRGRGSASYYPPGTDALFARLRGSGREVQGRDVLIWNLWLDPADYPVNIRRWVLRRIDKFLALLNDPRATEFVSVFKSPERTRALLDTLPRRHPARVVFGNLKDDHALAALCSWALDVANDRDHAVGLYATESTVLAALLRVSGLPNHLFSAPDKPVNPEMWSIAYLRELVKKAGEGAEAASEEEISQVRADCRAIAALANAASSVDWNAVSQVLDTDVAFQALTSRDPRSYRARRTERHAQRRNQLQPQAVRMFLAVWKNFDFRAAIAVPALVYFRRSPKHAKILPEIIALAHMALTLFPRRAAAARSNSSKALNEPAR
jgi:hypothetical protein